MDQGQIEQDFEKCISVFKIECEELAETIKRLETQPVVDFWKRTIDVEAIRQLKFTLDRIINPFD